MTFSEFRELAHSSGYRPPNCRDWNHLEKKYWSSIGIARPLYGANVKGSLMRGQSIWNLNDLGCILSKVLKSQNIVIPGVNTPYLYYGMWRSTFSWHVEDMDLYSINYLHQGCPKQWYVIPPAYARKFEAFVFEYFRSDFLKCNCLLRHKCILIEPKLLKRAGIPTRKILQRRGEFMITFPYAYHAGFNTGLNIAEAVNFALPRWIEFGKKAQLCTCWNDTVRISLDPFVRDYQPHMYQKWLRGDDDSSHPLDEYDTKRNKVVKKVTRKRKSTPVRHKGGVTDVSMRPSTSSKPNPTSSRPNLTMGDLNSIDVRFNSTAFSRAELPFHLKIHPNIASLWCGRKMEFAHILHFNRLIGNFKPHCAICALLWTPQKTALALSSPLLPGCIPAIGIPYLPEVAYASSSKEALSLELPKIVGSPILECSVCRLCVHSRCYGISFSPPPNVASGTHQSDSSENSFEEMSCNDWICDACSAPVPPCCLLCYMRGGAMKVLANPIHPYSGRQYWAHVVCALASPACQFIDVQHRLAAVSQEAVESARDAANCTDDISNSKRYGISHQCMVPRKQFLTRYRRQNRSGPHSPAKLSKSSCIASTSYTTQNSSTSSNFSCSISTVGDTVIPSPDPPTYSSSACLICHLPGRGHLPLPKCWQPHCSRRYHVTCAQLAGVVFGADAYPENFSLACDEHPIECITESHTTEEVYPGDRVMVRQAGYPPKFVPAVATRRVTPLYCSLSFPDGTFSQDTPPKFILDINWARDGPPMEGTQVRVLWDDAQEYDATFLGTTSERWEVRLDNDESIIVNRGDFYVPHESTRRY